MEAASKILSSGETHRVGIPLRRRGKPQDVAEPIAFLVLERAFQITLRAIAVDGARHSDRSSRSPSPADSVALAPRGPSRTD